jgi:Flp pilus assembly pilin Flp
LLGTRCMIRLQDVVQKYGGMKMNEVKNFNNEGKEKEEKGASLVEYALLVALIAVICIVAVRILGQKASQKFSTSASAL